MNPVPDTNPPNETSGCGNVISSTCISWQGGDIDCITICNGDTLTEVIQAIGQLACDALNAATYNTTPISEEEFNTFNEILQAIINEVANNTELITNFECDCPEYVLPSIVLPECVLDGCEACTEDPYPLDQALVIIGDYFCEQVAIVGEQIAQLEKEFLSLSAQIEKWRSQIEKDFQSQIDSEIRIIEESTLVTIAQHQLTGAGDVGTKIPVNQAVEYFADRMYEHISIVGSTKSITSSIGLEDSNLKNLPQLANAERLMLEFDGWDANPTTMSGSIANIWLTLQDMRSRYAADLATTTLPCVLLQPKNVSISGITTTNCTIAWDAHGLDTIQTELEYQVNIYAYDGFTAVGPSLASGVKERNESNPAHTLVVTTSRLNPDADYVVEVKALYPCGETEAVQIIGKIIACTQTMKVNAESRVGSITVEQCNGGNYNKITRDMRVVLTDNTNNVINNNTDSDITIRLRYRVVDPLIANDVYEEYDFVIARGNSASAWVEYVMYDQVFTGGNCEDIDRAENNAAVEILDPSECFIISGTVTFIP
jgi:hypothetical protein